MITDKQWVPGKSVVHYGRMAILLTSILWVTSCGSGGEDLSEFWFPLPEPGADQMATQKLTFEIQPLATGLEIPWGVAFLPDGRVLVTQRRGEIRVIEDGELTDRMLQGMPEVRAGGTSGLMDIALHPEYDSNGWIYIAYAKPDEPGSTLHNTAVDRFRLDGDQIVDRETLFHGEPHTERPSHSGSRMLFEDGYLFFSIGDRGTMEWAQETDRHAGSILRLYDDGRVPDDNPFVGVDGFQPEIWSYGHRNPQGLALNRETGEFWAVEHGPRGGDELNRIEKGVNYGWPEISASGIADDGSLITELTEMEGMVSHIHEWTPSFAPSDLLLVTSDRYPEWQGDLLVSGLIGMRLVRLRMDGDRVAEEENLLQGMGRFRSLTQAPDGFIYVTDDGSGTLFRLLPR